MLPGLQPIPASGKHFCLVEEVQKVKVDGSKVSAIQVRGHRWSRIVHSSAFGKVLHAILKSVT
jgi:hypothetical protein